MASRMPVTVTVITGMAARANRQLEWLRVGPQGSLRTAQWMSWRSGRRCDLGTVAAGPRGTESDLLGIKFNQHDSVVTVTVRRVGPRAGDGVKIQIIFEPKTYIILALLRSELGFNFEWAPKKGISHQISQKGSWRSISGKEKENGDQL